MPDSLSEPSAPSASPDLIPGPSTHPILFGPMGLRAGWGILLYLVAGALLTVLVYLALAGATGELKGMREGGASPHGQADGATGATIRQHGRPIPVGQGLVTETALAAGPLLAALALSYLERRRFASYGMGPLHVRNLLPGAFWGLAAMGVLVGTLRGLHLLVFDGQLDHGAAIPGYGAAWLLMFFLVGVAEEFLFRGYLQFTLTRGLLGLARRTAPGHPTRTAYLFAGTLTSLLFFVAHTSNGGENAPGLAGVFLAGILFCYALWRTGSLWWGIGFHATWDWSQSFLYGTADSGSFSAGRLMGTHPVGNPLLSGGSAGPEGSLFLLPVLLLVFLVLRLHPRAPQPAVQPE